MKLLRVGPPGKERRPLLDARGVIRDLSSVVKRHCRRHVAAGFAGQDSTDRSRRRCPRSTARRASGRASAASASSSASGSTTPITRPNRTWPVPAEPIIFMKATSCIVGPYDDVELPRGSQKSDWEVELGVVIGKPAKYVSEADAMSHVAGYCVVNDLSERAFQLEGTGQWVKGKSADTFGPIGPWLVTADEVPDCQNLGLWLEVDGHRYQDGTTKTMVFGVPVSRQLSEPLHEPAARRHHHDRHAARRRAWQEAAGVSARRQRDAARRRGAGRAAAAGVAKVTGGTGV